MASPSAPFLLVRPGSIPEKIREAFGDFDQWFVRASPFGASSFHVVDPTRDSLPPPNGYRGVLVTGSQAAAFGDDPWLPALLDFLRQTVKNKVPLLGVCFGHQAIAAALGGTVERNARGQELGTVELGLTPAGAADPSFQGVPRRFLAQASHDDHVVVLPPGARLLATNAHSEVQACRFNETTLGVQFHPEVTVDLVRAMILDGVRRGELTRAAAEKMLDQAAPAPEALRPLETFFQLR